MMKAYLFLTAACGTMLAQTPPGAGIVYQQAGVISVQSGPGRGVVTTASFSAMGPGIADLAGSPYSAVQQSHSLQVLGDGTRIETNESQQIYRDSMGRTRIESGPAGSGTVMIQDPVSKVTIVLNPATRTAQKTNRNIQIAMRALDQTTRLTASRPAGEGVVTALDKPVIEDFPAQNVNGVLATGHRTTLTIPAGEIGNDRPIQVVSETWYSSDLQMMVKSSNSDPRFGETSFELTNINRNEPDPSLFQVPADYVVAEPRSPTPRSVQPKE
jgi:hypothetical protein